MMVLNIYLAHVIEAFFPDSIKSLRYFPNIHQAIYTQLTKLFLTSNQYTEGVQMTKLKQT